MSDDGPVQELRDHAIDAIGRIADQTAGRAPTDVLATLDEIAQALHAARTAVTEQAYVTIVEAARLIGPRWDRGVGQTTVRKYFDAGLLRGYVTPKRYRKIERASIDELNQILEMPAATEEDRARLDATLVALAEHNRKVMAGHGGGSS